MHAHFSVVSLGIAARLQSSNIPSVNTHEVSRLTRNFLADFVSRILSSVNLSICVSMACDPL